MSDCPENKLIRQREGTTQQKRYNALLNPDNIKLMGFGVEDWMEFAQKFAANVNFFDGKDATNPQGNWEPFHNATEELKKVAEVYNEGDINPQLALFISFIKLLDLSKERFNTITKRHLDFYYKEVLQLDKKEAQADSVYTIYELAKNATEQLLEKDTLLDAGKDGEGNKRNYGVDEEIVLNKTTVALLQNTYIDNKGWYASTIANSGDGEGGEIANDKKSWLPFGDETRTLAKKGFSIAAPSLKLTEGPRNIEIIIKSNALKTSFGEGLQNIFKVEHTGKKEWIEIDKSKIIITIKKPDNTNEKPELKFSIFYDETAETIESYDKEIHEGNYNTKHPIFRITFDTEVENKETSFNLYKHLTENILEEIEIKTTAIYSSNIEVKSDLGKINLDNPFFPFGPQAKKNAKLKIGAKEWVGKNIEEVSLTLDWKGLPEHLGNHYQYYTYNAEVSTAVNEISNMLAKESKMVQQKEAKKGTVFLTTQTSLFVSGKYGSNRFKVYKSYIENNRVTIDDSSQNNEGEEVTLFTDPNQSNFNNFLSTPYILKKTDEYLIQIALKNTFLHEEYAKIYTYRAINELLLPNEPYTPEIEKLKVKIITKETLSDSQVSLFHEHPFGIRQETELKSIVPQLETGGQLFVGLDNTVENQNVQLLFQIEEGSEKPETIEKLGTEEATVTWQYLKNNIWQNLKPDYLLKDETDNFLKTGLVKITIPKETKNNSLFTEDYFWIQAKISTKFDSVSKIVNIHAQAVGSTFIDNNNTLEHLENGLGANTISKLEQRLATIKKLEQPYTSFNGIPKESDLDFYRRVSERLRHKNRAITVWDYEHLILQEFTYLHKIKCLNHSTRTSFNAPGNVLLVAVPNIINQNVYDIYKPKLSQAKLNAIKNYVNKLNTLHVDAEVISPKYEPVKIGLKAAFKENLDANHYTKQLKIDIAAYLSPWAFDKNQPIPFGNAMYYSEVIYFIENLEYIDYIKDFKMIHEEQTKKEIIPTDQKSILTTVEPTEHEVEAIITSLCQA